MNVVTHFLFMKTPKPVDSASVMCNLPALSIFFRTISETNSTDLKSTILYVLSQTFQIATPKEKDVLISDWDMFSILFGQFNEFSVPDRKLVCEARFIVPYEILDITNVFANHLGKYSGG